MSKLKVLIIGAGLGGLCLAQSLNSADVEVHVFERDSSPWDRPQGYRLHIDADGINALKAALPPDLFSLFEATSMAALPYTTVVDTGLNVLRRMLVDEEISPNGTPAHVNVNRASLRQILLTGLDEICHFNMRLERYERDATGVIAYFADGSKVRGDILVGADGIRSAVRKHRLPEARIADTGVRAIYGRIPIETARRLLPEHALSDVFTIASDTRKVFFGLGPVIFPTRPEVASLQHAPAAALPGQDDYVVSIVGGRKEYFGANDETLRRASSAELQLEAARMLQSWPDEASSIPAEGDPTSFFFVEMNTSVPCDMGKPDNVVLLGDAIHAMTPTLGRGANVAMRDGALLGRLLKLCADGELELGDALSSYESEMAQYGFGVVRESAALGQRLMGQEPLPA